ncbi:MAG TPA: AAA family ATPase [Candidatus Dormibacteraeota bacterium]|nr:AAA family ATPase [Candidatus Dormibacteraeota bacterium]
MDPDSSRNDDPVAPAEKGDGDASRGRSAQGAFVGRDTEMSQALAVLEDVLAQRGRLLLIAGEAGIGKSRMADELATRAEKRGFEVVWGRCWEAGGAPVYWPWAQSLRSLIRNQGAEALRAHMGSGAIELAQLLPEIRGHLGEIPTSPTLDPDAARFRLFDSATYFLKNSAAVRPIMLVLDDLQVADTPSLLLLRFVAGALTDDRILLLGTYRDTELGPEQALSPTLRELAREPAVRRVSLRGLLAADVPRFIEATTGFTPQESLVRTVHEQTGGNPLFLQEVTRLLLEVGRLDREFDSEARIAIPQSAREVVAQRLKPLSGDSRDLLMLASILGREFSLDALSRLVDRPLDDIFELLGQPLASRVVTDVPGSRMRLRFSHVVIREGLYDDIPRARRMQLHRLAGDVFEGLYAEDLEPHLAELAHHFFEGAAEGHVEKAIEYARRAGENAVSLLAYEEAVRLYRMALRGLELRITAAPQERCELLLALGDAQARAGDEAGRKQTFLEAAKLSESLGLSDQLARAALGYGGRLVHVRAGGDAHVIPLLEGGLAAVGKSDSVLRARILARLAGALRDDPSPEPRESLAREAVELARRLGDPAALAYTLEGLHAALWKPDNQQERLAIASEMVALGLEAMDRERLMIGHQNQALVFLELGDIPSVYQELDAVDRVEEELRQPAHSWVPIATRAELALLEGRFDDAEPLIDEAFRLRGRTNRSDAIEGHTVQLFQLRREQGRLKEIEHLLQASAREFTWYPMLRCALAALHCELGRETQARAEFEELAAEDFAGIPFDNKWLFSVALLGEIAYFLGDDPRARTLYERLLPYADLTAVAGGDVCPGSMSRYLGLLTAVMLRTDEAAGHFEAGLRSNERMGARPSLARTQHDFAVMLVKRAGHGDKRLAVRLLGDAHRTCVELGMPALQTKIADLLADLGVVASAAQIETSDSMPRSLTDGTLRLEGEYWTIGYEGKVSRLRDSKGLRVLARLLADPGRPHAALDLERLGASGDEATARAVASGDAGELIDDDARRAYRSRLTELREAIEDADAQGNADQVGAMREEMDYINHELSRALGLGGRARVAGSIAERARLNVTRAVKSAMQRISSTDSALASHLEATVHTGTVCVYTPDPRSPVGWQVSLGDVHKD